MTTKGLVFTSLFEGTIISKLSGNRNKTKKDSKKHAIENPRLKANGKSNQPFICQK